MTAIVHYLRNGSVELRTPYNAEFVEQLKCDIPWDSRTWDRDTKLWTVDQWYAHIAQDITEYWFDDVRVIDDRETSPPPPPRSSSSSPDPFRALHLLPTAPAPLIDAAYKTLARLFHPDTGGDLTTMQQINAAYDKLKDRSS